jgi:hypothetical protein
VKVSPARYRQRALVPWRRSRSRQSRSLPHEEGLGQPKPPTKKKKAPERGVPGLTVWGHHGRVSPWDRSPSSKGNSQDFPKFHLCGATPPRCAMADEPKLRLVSDRPTLFGRCDQQVVPLSRDRAVCKDPVFFYESPQAARGCSISCCE